MAKVCTIVWLRRDLRLEDNPALCAAARAGLVVLVFIWSPQEEGQFHPGRVSRWWLKQSLMQLDVSLQSLGAPLVMRKTSDTLSTLLELVETTGASQIFYNHLYDPISLVRDHHVKQGLTQRGIQVQSFNGELLYEPWEVLNEEGKPFTCFESYWQKCLNMPFEPDSPLLPPRRLTSIAGSIHTCTPEELGLENNTEKSSNALLARAWTPGWSNADRVLEAFLAGPLLEYSRNRHKIDGPTTSLLSPYMHFGEVSVRKVYHSVRRLQILCAKDGSKLGEESINAFMRSIGFREYSRYLSFNFPFTHTRSLLSNLKSFPWRVDESLFKAWRQGRTGYPLVDAGMRELWATGWLHNRVRVIVSSFCVKFLQIPWSWGMKYFWDTLLDADLESDVLGWQYISGSLPGGHELDRMDNPQTEGYKHDPLGEYVRRWLPELIRLPTEWIHHPWDAPPGVLRAAGVELGSNYPWPIVEVAAARERLQRAVSQMWEQEAALKATGIGIDQEALDENLHVKVVTQPLDSTQSVKVPMGALLKAGTNVLQVPSISSYRNQMGTGTKQLEVKTALPGECLNSPELKEIPVSSQQGSLLPSTVPVGTRIISQASSERSFKLINLDQAPRSTYTLAPPPVSDVNSTAVSCSYPKRQRVETRKDASMVWVPAIAHLQRSWDFGYVPYDGDAGQLRQYLLSLQNSRRDRKVEGAQLSGTQWLCRMK